MKTTEMSIVHPMLGLKLLSGSLTKRNTWEKLTQSDTNQLMLKVEPFRYSIDIDKVYNEAQLPRTINLHQKKKKKALLEICKTVWFVHKNPLFL